MNYSYNEELMLKGIEEFRREQKQRTKPPAQVTADGRFTGIPKRVRDVVTLSCQLYGLSPKAVLAGAADRKSTIVRQIIVLMLRAEFSSPEIGKFLGRHHTTILNAERVAKQRYWNTQGFKKNVDTLRQKLKSEAV
jgi:chromosomal replication initiation ATPase DnaA